VPHLTTMHGRIDLPGLPVVIREFPEASFVSISDNQRLPLPDANWCGTVQHGLPTNLFRPSYGKGSYLAFLGRLTAEKGSRKSHSHRTRRPDALAHRRQNTARRNRVLQEAS